jgi:putative ATPase
MAAHVAAGRGAAQIETADIEESLQRRIIRYDKSGDQHYDIISAFIKSMRGSDPDGAMFWLHTMLGAGEDPEFVARRMIIFASEDVGLADPSALQTAVGAFHALQVVGLPEASFALSEAAIYLATAPKSNSVTTAMGRARDEVEANPGAQVPPHLRDAHYPGAQTLGHGVGYRYPHDYEGHIVKQTYLPDVIEKAVIYVPGTEGYEREIDSRLKAWDQRLSRPNRTDR